MSELVTGADRKNGWARAEQDDEISPDGMQ